MKAYLVPFATFIVSMLLVDAVWLGIMVKRFYSHQIGHLMSVSPNLSAAAVFYLVYGLTLTILVLHPSINSDVSLGHVFFLGAVFGLATYGTYDLTNQATLKDWPTVVTVVDIVWGMVLTGSLSASTVALLR